MPSELFRIFWPLEIQWRKGSSGWMIGWKSNQAAVIATCIWNTTVKKKNVEFLVSFLSYPLMALYL